MIKHYYMQWIAFAWHKLAIGLLLFVSGPPIRWQFHSFLNPLQSSLIRSRNIAWSNHIWWGFCGLSMCNRSSRVKNARQRRANWVPTSTHKRSIRVLRVDLEQDSKWWGWFGNTEPCLRSPYEQYPLQPSCYGHMGYNINVLPTTISINPWR